MAPKKKARQGTLQGSNLWPLLKKTNHAIGKFCNVPGAFWDGCPAADKNKNFKCIVVEFIAMHTFNGGRKGPAFKMKEMGESGEGSLEPGIASGDDFVLSYPTPFLEYYYAANCDDLPVALRPQGAEPVTPAGCDDSRSTASRTSAAGAAPTSNEKEKVRPPIGLLSAAEQHPQRDGAEAWLIHKQVHVQYSGGRGKHLWSNHHAVWEWEI